MKNNNNEPAAFDSDGTPLKPDGNPMLTFEVKMRPLPNGTVENAVFIGGEILDWSMDVSSLLEARKMGPKYFKAVQRDVEKHYAESVSEFIGRKVTSEDIQKATKTGWI
ncbi:MAG: hypothetical protein ACW99G_00285 [Candidatus Thorarchaeota archaeon]|jgi:hypothetical protein